MNITQEQVDFIRMNLAKALEELKQFTSAFEYAQSLGMTMSQECADERIGNAVGCIGHALIAMRTDCINPENLTFITPPECGGQLVELSFAIDKRGVWRRTQDHREGGGRLEFASWDSLPDDLKCEPWNHAPLVPSEAWQRVSW